MASLWAQERSEVLWDEWATDRPQRGGPRLIEYIAEAIDAAELYGYNRALGRTPNIEVATDG